jgi:hypothetical protein
LEHRAEVFGGVWHRPNLNWWDLAALALIVAVILAVGSGARQMLAPFAAAQPPEISLAPAALPNYALRTTLRMMLALGVSLVFTFTCGMLAANNRRAEMVLVPPVRAGAGLSLLHRGVLRFLGAEQGAGNRACRDLCHLYQPGLEYGLQLLPVPAYRSARSQTKRAAAFAFPPSAVPRTSAALCSHNRPYLPRTARMHGELGSENEIRGGTGGSFDPSRSGKDAAGGYRVGAYAELFAYDVRTHTFSAITKAE